MPVRLLASQVPRKIMIKRVFNTIIDWQPQLFLALALVVSICISQPESLNGKLALADSGPSGHFSAHYHSPGTPVHSHAEPGTAGDLLNQKLEDELEGTSPSGHEGSEGLALSSNHEETVRQGAQCSPDDPVREYRVAAINLDFPDGLTPRLAFM
jgi:hypothetical protein